jgi:CCR4-NOT transcription complex subunit 6
MRRPDFKKTEDMFNRVMRRDDIAVLALLEHKESGARLIVANVHIYWDPEYRDVKLVQVAMMMDEITKTADHFARLPPKLSLGKGYEKAPHYNEGRQIPTVICGDFNSVTDSGVYQFLANSSVPGDHEDFMKHIYGHYTSEGISHKFSLKSAYSHLESSPDKHTGGLNLTNYVPGFRGVIDYIWYNSAALSVTGLLGEIDQSYLNKVVGFPNAHFPSDHISILAELRIKPQYNDGGPPPPRHFKPLHHPHR